MTNEIVRLVIITYQFPYNSKICSSPFWAGWPQNIVVRFIVAKGCASARNLTWFTRPFPLVRGWGLGTRLGVSSHLASFQQWNWLWEQSLSILEWSKTISYYLKTCQWAMIFNASSKRCWMYFQGLLFCPKRCPYFRRNKTIVITSSKKGYELFRVSLFSRGLWYCCWLLPAVEVYLV